jgi:undecaprenyl diphosphate synthase
MSAEISDRLAGTESTAACSASAVTGESGSLPPPTHIAIIMDGNGRWARERGLPRIKGHEQGATSVRAVTEACAELGVGYLTVFAFSTENWKRPKEETDALMGLLEHFIAQELPGLMKNKIRLRAIGRLRDLPPNCRQALQEAIDATAHNDRMTLILALSYSGRSELIDAVRALCREAISGELNPDEIDSARISAALDTRDFPDPDLLIRTSGEMRLSNFLLWQLSYTEIYVTEKLWPDFGKDDLRDAIVAFHKRERRFGGI